MRFRKFGIHYGTLNDGLLAKYKNVYPQMKSDAGIACYLIESRLIFRTIETFEDMEAAKEYAHNLFYSDLGEWINAQLRADIINKISICKNCPLIEKNNFCPILGSFVNPNQTGCHNM